VFCYQCEQTSGGAGCRTIGVCGKTSEAAALQDLIVYQLKGIGWLACRLSASGWPDSSLRSEVNRYTVEALFTTVTNVNFDPERLAEVVRAGGRIRDTLAKACAAARVAEPLPAAARYAPPPEAAEMKEHGEAFGVLADDPNEDIRSLRQLLVYGLKGMAAYADHALILGKSDDAIFAFMHEALAALASQGAEAPNVDALVSLCMRCGEVNVRTMALLDEAHTARFGHPAPAVVSTGRRPGPAIVVSGHDLLDLEALLQQTEGTGVNVYTHGEMLPAHGYPGLRKFPHLAGHFGTAWQNQQKELDGQPAAFLFTTNCIQKPRPSYKDRVFTTGLVAFPGVAHVNGRDFSAVIAKARALGGFTEQAGRTLTTGFGHNAVLSVADKVVAAVKSGAIKRFFLVGGCDGAKPGRNYYTELAEKAPRDTVILTLACGKFRINHLELGTIDGIPRLLDVGQCNDAYSAVVIAQALAGALGCGVNELPLNLILSWYEQKAVVILLSLLSLGIKGIRLGPSLPAFISANILAFLVEKFDIKPISTVEEDLKAIFA
jgi:hydroxylamine reductase